MGAETKQGQEAPAARPSIDRAGWPRGEWDHEPDRIDFEHAGLPCLMLRNHGGAWCGYAAVPPGHPLHGKDYGQIDATAHGGLTYSDKCSGEICHVPKPGEPDDVWWFGFDCSHGCDVVPGFDWRWNDGGGAQYRNVAYVRYEAEKLAEQLAAEQGNAP